MLDGVSAADTSSPPALPSAAPRHDVPTVIAITAVATAITDQLHELVGHGGACVLSGFHPLVVSTVHFECSMDSRFVAAGGTIVNLIAGTIFLLIARKMRSPSARFFFWLLMTFSFLDAGGYFLFSGIADIGDWADVIQGLQPAWAWHVTLTVIGVMLYLFFVRVSLVELQPLLSPDRNQRLRRARRLLFIPYFAHGILMTIAGLFNPVGMILVAISAMAASFGGCSGMLWMGMWLRGNMIRPPADERPVIARSFAWIVAGIVVAIPFIFVLGRGIRL
jgi:hypothetical protein